MNKNVHGIIRGTLDDDKTRDAYINKTKEKTITTPCLFMKGNKFFFLCSASNREGWTKEDRLDIDILDATISYLKYDLKIKAKAAILTMTRKRYL